MGHSYRTIAPAVYVALKRPDPLLSLRIEDTPGEQHGVRLPVPDEEQEWMVGFEDLGFGRQHDRASCHEYRRGRCRLGAFLVDLDERLVDNFGNRKRLIPDATEIGVGA